MGEAFDRCVRKVGRSGRVSNAYAVCTTTFQRAYGKQRVRAMRKSVRRNLAGEVVISDTLQRRLSQWHASQGDPVYAVQSSAYAGYPVPIELAEDAVYSLNVAKRQLLKRLGSEPGYASSYKRALKHLMVTKEMLEDAIERAQR